MGAQQTLGVSIERRHRRAARTRAVADGYAPTIGALVSEEELAERGWDTTEAVFAAAEARRILRALLEGERIESIRLPDGECSTEQFLEHFEKYWPAGTALCYRRGRHGVYYALRRERNIGQSGSVYFYFRHCRWDATDIGV